MKIHKSNAYRTKIKVGMSGPICDLFKCNKEKIIFGWYSANSAMASMEVFSDAIHKWDDKITIARIGK